MSEPPARKAFLLRLDPAVAAAIESLAVQELRSVNGQIEWLLRLTPDDLAGIEKAGVAVIGELDGPNRIHRRTLARLGKLEQKLREWNTSPARDAVAAKLRTRVAQTCAQSSGDAVTMNGCRAFGAGV